MVVSRSDGSQWNTRTSDRAYLFEQDNVVKSTGWQQANVDQTGGNPASSGMWAWLREAPSGELFY